MIRHSLVVFALATLAACGGDSDPSDDYQATLAAANAKRSEALSLAPASPCNAVQQCANLQLLSTDGHCTASDYHPYSLASPTAAAASDAAAEERDLIRHAVLVAPPPITACTAVVTLPPSLACTANTCVAVPIGR